MLARVRAAREPAAGGLLGLEHEYRVFDPAGVQVDFRALLPSLAIDGRPLDPGDAHARRLAWGAVLTADEREAEIALPPLRPRAGSASLVRDLAERARAELSALLPAGYTVVGYSTHLSVAMPTDMADAIAHRYARTFAPALMLLLDASDAPGLLVRPRPGRLELGGDHRSGDPLRAAVLFALGSARALADPAIRAGVPLLGIDPAAAVDRYGWYVDRAAFGADLYVEGRATPLPLAEGGTILAGDLLARAWAISRRTLGDMATPDDLALVDRLVAGELALPIEAAVRAAPTVDTPAPQAAAPATPEGPIRAASAFRAPEGGILDDVVRPGFTLRATLATWEFAAFEVAGSRRAVVAVPRAELGVFLTAAATGALDQRIVSFLARPSAGTQLSTREQATGPAAIYDGIGDPRGLLAVEPDGDPGGGTAGRAIRVAANAALVTGRLGGVDLDPIGLGGGRPGKHRRQDRHDPRSNQPSNPTPPASHGPPVPVPTALIAVPATALPVVPLILGGVGVAVVVAVLVVGVALGGKSNPSIGPSATAQAAATAAASAIVAAASPSASPASSQGVSASPGSSAAPAATPPPIADARLAGTYADGPDDSFHLVVTPSCQTGACDASATILSVPFADASPRGPIAILLPEVGGTYSGAGTAVVPMCRTTAGKVLSTSQTYTLGSLRPTEQLLMNGQWVATTVEGTVTVGAATVKSGGTTCTTSGFADPVVLHLIGPEAGPAPPLADARFSGSYRVTPAAATSLSVLPDCESGACSAAMTYVVTLLPDTTVTAVAPLTLTSGSYDGQGVSQGLLCAPGARVDVTMVFSGLHATNQAVIDGQWVATALTGTVRRLAFKGQGCSGAEASTTVVLTRVK